MATCKDCFHYESCGGFTPTDLDRDAFNYCKEGRTDEIPDIEERCNFFKSTADVAEIIRCKNCEHYNGYRYCRHFEELVFDDDFCSYGKRKEEEE